LGVPRSAPSWVIEVVELFASPKSMIFTARSPTRMRFAGLMSR
jgi:hypothetical protein